MKVLEVKPYDINFKISDNHVLGEFIESELAYKNKMIMQYVHQETILNNLVFLCNKIINPIEKSLNKRLAILSGYRCHALNLLYSFESSKNHLHGLAVDIQKEDNIRQIAEIVQELEFDELFVYNSHIHIAVKPFFNKRLFMDNRY